MAINKDGTYTGYIYKITNLIIAKNSRLYKSILFVFRLFLHLLQ